MAKCKTLTEELAEAKKAGFNEKELQALSRLIQGTTESALGQGEKKSIKPTYPKLKEQPSYANAVLNKFGGVAPIRFKDSDSAIPQTITEVKVEYANLSTTIHTNSGIYTFRKNSDTSIPTSQGNYVTMDGLADITSSFISKDHEKAIIQEHENLLSNAKEPKISAEFDVHGVTKKMQHLVSQLNELDANPTNKTRIKELQSLLGKMDEKFFTEMRTIVTTGTTSSKGYSTDKQINIDTSSVLDLAANTQNAAEAYTNQVVQAYTKFALRKGTHATSKIHRELRNLRSTLAETMSWKDFLPNPDNSIDPNQEKINAQKMWKHVFENISENNLQEFLGYALTNPKMVEVAKKTNVRNKKEITSVFQFLSELFGTIMSMLKGQYSFFNKNSKVYKEFEPLLQKLGELNNEAVVAKNEKAGAVAMFTKFFNTSEEGISNFTKKKLSRIAAIGKYKPLPKNASKADYALWFAKFMPRLILKKEMRPHLSHVLKALGLGTSGIVQNVLRDFKSPDDLRRGLDMIQRAAGKIDRFRNSTVVSVKASVSEGFTESLSSDQEIALTSVILDTDLQVLYTSLGEKKVHDILINDTLLEKETKKVRSMLKKLNPKFYNWNATEAVGLGYYMATGKSYEAQSMNASSIARGITRKKEKEVIEGEVELIDQLATLSALKFTDNYEKNVVADLITKESAGVNNIIGIHKGFIEQSLKELFDDIPTNQIKGYTKGIYNNSIGLKVAPYASKTEMEEKGYERMHSIPADTDIDTVPMAIYRSKSFNRQEYYRTSTRLSGRNKRGTSLSEIALERGTPGVRLKAQRYILKTHLKRLKQVEAIDKGTFAPEDVQHGKAPLTDETGKVVDYRYLMDKQTKIKLLEQDRKVSHVLGKSVGSIVDKSATDTHNKEVLKFILTDMTENYVPGHTIGSNDYEYLKIGPKSRDPYVRELWKMLPSGMKKLIEKTPLEHIAVREDMLFNYFGFRHFSIANNKVSNLLPALIRTVLKLLEHIWQSIVGTAVVDILFRVPIVIIENIFSNITFSLATGTSIPELAKMYLEESRNIVEYSKKRKEYSALMSAKASGNVLKKDLGKIPRLKIDLESNDIHELFEQGIYEYVTEGMEEYNSNREGPIKYINKKFEKLPDSVKTTWNWMNVNEKTAWYKHSEKMLRMGDLLGQAVENRKRKLINKKTLAKKEASLIKEGVSADLIESTLNAARAKLDADRLSGISEDFIFYAAPASVFEEYMNKMGLILFTKYIKRIQRITGKTFLNNPLRSVSLVAADEVLFDDDVETIFDQTFLDKALSDRLGSSFQDFTDILERNTPIALRFAYDHHPF